MRERNIKLLTVYINMNKLITKLHLLFILLWSIEVHAATTGINWGKIIIEIIPIIFFIITFLVLLKWSQKKANDVNNKIVESNEEVARQIKRIADHFEKNS